MKQQLLIAFIAAGAIASAQENRIQEEKVMMRVGGLENHVFTGGEMSSMATVSYVSAEFSSEGKQVKGQPYSADTSTESTQTLSDGTKITNKTTARIFRDSEGRTRREQALRSVGPWSTANVPQSLVFINDPVSGTNYVLDTDNKTVRKTTISNANARHVTHAVPRSETLTLTHSPAKDKDNVAFKNESLGKQTVEGLVCDGTRTVLTIPAGQIGNDRPIEVVTEKWFSPDLQVTVMSKTTDPRMGDTLYRLAGISRSEPAHTLFEVPADYTAATEGPVVTERVLRFNTQQ